MSRLNAQLPAQLGYRMPAEWEPHEATWIAWPHNRDDWPGKFAPFPGSTPRSSASSAASRRCASWLPAAR